MANGARHGQKAREAENAALKQTVIMTPQGKHAFWPDRFLCLEYMTQESR